MQSDAKLQRFQKTDLAKCQIVLVKMESVKII